MPLLVQREGTTTTNLTEKPQMCYTCKTRKTGLFSVDGNGNPRCADCCRAVGRPIPGSEEPVG
jgi:hypothetical protein